MLPLAKQTTADLWKCTELRSPLSSMFLTWLAIPQWPFKFGEIFQQNCIYLVRWHLQEFLKHSLFKLYVTKTQHNNVNIFWVVSLANIFICITMQILDLNTNVVFENICLLVRQTIYMPLSWHFISVLPTTHDMHYRLIMGLVINWCHRSRIPVNYWHSHNGAIVPRVIHQQQIMCFFNIIEGTTTVALLIMSAYWVFIYVLRFLLRLNILLKWLIYWYVYTMYQGRITAIMPGMNNQWLRTSYDYASSFRICCKETVAHLSTTASFCYIGKCFNNEKYNRCSFGIHNWYYRSIMLRVSRVSISVIMVTHLGVFILELLHATV